MPKWETVTNNAIDIKGHKEKPFVGTYVGKKDVQTKVGPQVIWQFMDDDEQPFAIYGFTNLNRAMEGVGVNAFCRITYKGTAKVQTKYGLKDVHQVVVERQVPDHGSDEDPLPEE